MSKPTVPSPSESTPSESTLPMSGLSLATPSHPDAVSRRSPSAFAALRAARKRYKADAVPALDSVDLSLHGGELHALLGANGAGKSTAIGLLLGLLRADEGEVLLFGEAPQALAARRRIGVMLQSAELPDNSTVSELLMLTRSYYSQPRSVADCVAEAGIDGLLDRRYGRLSGGQQRRVQFALAVCGDPALLFLDEPTVGLDIEARRLLWAAIRRRVDAGCGVLLTTHYLEEAEALADRVTVLDRGRVIATGTMDAVRARIAQRRIRCLSALPAERVAGWPGVRDARREGVRLEILAEPAEPVVRRLLAEDDALSELEIARAGLVEVFVALTAQGADNTIALEHAA